MNSETISWSHLTERIQFSRTLQETPRHRTSDCKMFGAVRKMFWYPSANLATKASTVHSYPFCVVVAERVRSVQRKDSERKNEHFVGGKCVKHTVTRVHHDTSSLQDRGAPVVMCRQELANWMRWSTSSRQNRELEGGLPFFSSFYTSAESETVRMTKVLTALALFF